MGCGASVLAAAAPGNAPSPDKAPYVMGKDARIVILGAGPAGLHLASRLKQQGCTQITILERTFRYGGKTHTVNEYGNPNDIGTCWMHPGYTPVIELIAKYGAGPIPQPNNDVSSSRHAVEVDGKREPFAEWVLDEVEDVTLPGWMRPLLPDVLQGVPLALAIRKYCVLHREIFGDYEYSLLPEPSEANKKRIAKPFTQFLKDEGLVEIQAIVLVMQTAQGYGFLETVPAFYGLSWCTPTLMECYLTLEHPDQHGFPIAIMMLLRKGFLHLWDRMVEVEELNQNIEYGAHVQAIRRRGVGPGTESLAAPVEIDLRREQPKGEGPQAEKAGAADGRVAEDFFSLYPPSEEVLSRESAAESPLETLSCDHLFFAAPFDVVLPLLGPEGATADEREIVGAMRPMTLVASLFTSPSLMERPIESMVAGSALKGEGRLYSVRHTRRVNDPALPPPLDGKEPYIAHQLFDRRMQPGEVAAARATMLEDLGTYGYQDVEVRKYCAFNTYLPHFDVDGVCAKRYPWRLLALQGANNTCWVGSSACFESVLDVVNYNNLLLDKKHVQVAA